MQSSHAIPVNNFLSLLKNETVRKWSLYSALDHEKSKLMHIPDNQREKLVNCFSLENTYSICFHQVPLAILRVHIMKGSKLKGKRGNALSCTKFSRSLSINTAEGYMRGPIRQQAMAAGKGKFRHKS